MTGRYNRQCLLPMNVMDPAREMKRMELLKLFREEPAPGILCVHVGP